MDVELLAFSWIVALLCFPRHLETKPIGLALPPGSNKLKTAVACENQKAYILCPNIFNGIHIESAMFGRKSATECTTPDEPRSSFCSEQEDQIKQQVKDLCQGEDKCEVSASNDFLAMEGTEVCPRVSKYLEVQYRCVPRHTIEYDDSDESNSVVTETVGDTSVQTSSSSTETEVLPSSSSSSSSATEVITSPPSSSTSSSSSATEVITSPPSSSSSSSSQSSTAILSSSSSPASEVQVLLDSHAKDKDNSAVVDISTEPSSSQSSQEVTEPLKNQQSTEDDNDVVKETVRKSEITEENEKKDDKSDKDDNKTDSGLDETGEENRNDDKYWR